MRRVATGEHPARQQQGFAGAPSRDILPGHRVEIDTSSTADVPGDLWPIRYPRGGQLGRARAIEHEVRMAGRGAIGDHCNRQIGSVGGVIPDLDVHDCGQPAQTLCADAECIDLVVDLQSQLLGPVLGAACDQVLDVHGLHQGFLG